MKPAADSTLADHFPGRHRLVETLEILSTQVAVFEKPPTETPRLLRHDDHAGTRQGFQSRGKIQRAADRGKVFSSLGKIAHDDNPSRNADVDSHVHRSGWWPLRLRNAESGPDGSFSIVFVSAWIAEVRQDRVAHVPCDDAAVAGDDVGAALAIGLNDIGELFWIEPQRERSRRDHVAEHHRQLTALGRSDALHDFQLRADFETRCNRTAFPRPALATISCPDALAVPNRSDCKGTECDPALSGDRGVQSETGLAATPASL